MVLDEQGELSGVLTLWDLRLTWRVKGKVAAGLTARDLKSKTVVTVTPEDNFDTAFRRLAGKNYSFLPVVLPPPGRKVVGILKREDLLTAYQQKLLRDRLRSAVPISRAQG